MPSIIKPEDMQESHAESGWTVRTVTDTEHLGAPAMVARWWTFEPGVQGPERTRGDSDEILYVIRGTGTAVVNDQKFDLEDESVLWLEEDERYYVIAGEGGLEILQGYAPGGQDND